MNIVEVYARNTDGTIAHIYTPTLRGTPEADTRRVARFDTTAHPDYADIYNIILGRTKSIRFQNGDLIELRPIGTPSLVADSTWITARESEIVAFLEERTGDVTAKTDILSQAETALNQIDSDNVALTADLALLPGADNATTKQIIGRAIQAFIRNNNRQYKTIRALQAILRNGL